MNPLKATLAILFVIYALLLLVFRMNGLLGICWTGIVPVLLWKQNIHALTTANYVVALILSQVINFFIIYFFVLLWGSYSRGLKKRRS